MKEISIRELHRNTGAWVRSARKYGTILVRDRRRPIARITPASEEPEANRFASWAPLRRYAMALERPVGGRPAEDTISEDRYR